jgi:thioredoxin-related protein
MQIDICTMYMLIIYILVILISIIAFVQAGKDTVNSSGVPMSPPLISANFACANDKRYINLKKKSYSIIKQQKYILIIEQ